MIVHNEAIGGGNDCSSIMKNVAGGSSDAERPLMPRQRVRSPEWKQYSVDAALSGLRLC